MTLFYEEMAKVFILLIFNIFCRAYIICILSFNNFKSDTEKLSAYECGFDKDARNVFFDVRFT
jgi:NADH:ubiquinone oxidoreductase subunit 3 (subunit A)